MAAHVWISEQGPGPLVVVRKSLLEYWRGLTVPESERSDYGVACAIGEVGCIAIRGGSVLVLTSNPPGNPRADPLRTTWLPKPQGGMFVRWVAGSDEAAAIAATESGADATWTPTGCAFTTAGGEHLLFPASQAGEDTTRARLAFQLREGEFAVSSARLEGGDASVLVYRLVWRPKARR